MPARTARSPTPAPLWSIRSISSPTAPPPCCSPPPKPAPASPPRSRTTPAAELTRVDLPYKGSLTWAYSPFTFLGNVTTREVSSRGLIKSFGASTVTYNLDRDPADVSQYMHTSLVVKDPSTVGAKKWFFSSANNYTRGFVTQLDEAADWDFATVLRRSVMTYAQDANTVPYLKSTNTTLNPGTGSSKETRTEQTLDIYGNVTEIKEFDFNALVTPARTTYCEYYFVTLGQPNPHYLNRLPRLCYRAMPGNPNTGPSSISPTTATRPNTLDSISGSCLLARHAELRDHLHHARQTSLTERR